MKKFETERAFYNKHKSEWLKDHDHQFVLIKGEKLYGIFASFADAFNAGIEKIGPEEDFFIEEILKEQPTNFVYIANQHAHP